MGTRAVVLLMLAALAAGVAAFLALVTWADPLLDGSRIDSYAFGPFGANIREFEVHPRDADGGFVDRVLGLVNEAPLAGERVSPAEGDVLLVLYRDDGLQFHLTSADPVNVTLSEGDGSYRGTLRSPELAALLAELDLTGGG